MNTYQIQHQIGIKAPLDSVYQALSTAGQLARWWTSDTRGKSEVGSTLEFWFGQHCQKFEVTALVAGELVRWKAGSDTKGDWAGTEISFKLRSDDKQTWVHFTHSKWANDSEFLSHCSTKWAVFMLSLKDLLETGTGHPYPNDVQINHN